LYEIAKELGKESKEVVARAKELGFDVKSHSSSVEADAGERIKSSFTKKAAAPQAPEEKPAAAQPSPQKTPAKEAAPVKAEPTEAKAAAKPEAKTETAAPVKRPQSRNFKAEREARAKEEAERRKQQGNRKPQNKEQGKREDRDNRNKNRGNRNDRDRGNRPNDRRDNRGQDGRRNGQNHQGFNGQNRQQPQGPKIDFKARAAALKAEQNAEYARSSEERFKQAQEANQLLIDTFLKRLAEISHVEQRTTREFLQKRVVTAKSELEQAENKLQQFQVDNKVYSTADQMKGLTDKVTLIDREKAQNQLDLETAQAALGSINEQLGSAGKSIADSATVQAYKGQLADLESRKASYIGKYTDEHPAMKEINQQIEEAKKEGLTRSIVGMRKAGKDPETKVFIFYFHMDNRKLYFI